MGLENTFGPTKLTISCNTIWRHSTRATKTRAWGLLLQTCLLSCQMHMENKQKNCSGDSVVLLSLFFYTPVHLQLESCCKGAYTGDEWSPAHFSDGWIWMLLLVCAPEVKAQQIRCQMSPISCSFPTPLALSPWTRGVQGQLVPQIFELSFSVAQGSIPAPHS